VEQQRLRFKDVEVEEDLVLNQTQQQIHSLAILFLLLLTPL